MTVVTGKLILIKATLRWFLILRHSYCITSWISMFDLLNILSEVAFLFLQIFSIHFNA